MRLAAVAVACLAALGCDPGTADETQALVADLTEDGYRPVVRTLYTLGEGGDGDALEGAAAKVRGLGEVSLVVPFDTPRTIEGFRDAMVVDGGETVRPRWTTVDGALYPRDFDAFALTTLYHHIEQADLYFASLGAPLSGPLDVLYLGTLTIPGLGSEPALIDNVIYFFGVRLLVVTKFEALQDVPLGMNRGVVVHEIGHASFDELVYDDDAKLRLLSGEIDNRTGNLLRAMTEGLSDFFAAAQSDPRFLDPSLAPELLAFSRSVDVPATLTDGMLDGAGNPPSVFDPYVPGTCLASALWRMPIDRAVLGAALVDAQRALGDRLREEPPWDAAPESFGFAWLLDALILALPTGDRDAACSVIVEQLPPAAMAMEQCR